MTIKIKNWSDFQHFKDRRPPWIKLYRDILDDYDISMISDRSFRVLVNLWLLASEDKTGEGNLPHVDAIAHRLRIKKESIIRALEECSNFLIQDDITPSSNGYQNDRLETEKRQRRDREETEKRTNDFCIWYDLYPRKKARAAALKAWENVEESVDAVNIIEATRSQIESGQIKNDQYTPHPSTWLNQRRWDDEIETSAPQQATLPDIKYGIER